MLHCNLVKEQNYGWGQDVSSEAGVQESGVGLC